MIHVASSDAIPNTFTLTVPGKGLSANVRVIWRKPQSLGLALVGDEAAQAASASFPAVSEGVKDTQAALIEALRAQNAQLHAELAALRERLAIPARPEVPDRAH